MSVYYGEVTPYGDMKFAEAIGSPLFNGDRWVNTSLIQSDPMYENHPTEPIFCRFPILTNLTIPNVLVIQYISN